MTKSVFFTIFHLGGVFYFVTSGGSSSEKLIPVVGARSGFADEEDENPSLFYQLSFTSEVSEQSKQM